MARGFIYMGYNRLINSGFGFGRPLRWLYDYAWFIGFGVSGAVYVVLMQRADAPAWEAEG